MSARRHTGTSTQREMHRCGNCDSGMVQPVEWTEAPGNGWEVELRCPECEWRQESVFSQREVDSYDCLLDDGQRALIDDLRRLTRENMEVETVEFASALASELILPEDF